MPSITVDKETAEKLRQLTQVTEIRDEEGRLVGYFAPVGVPFTPPGLSRTEVTKNDEPEQLKTC